MAKCGNKPAAGSVLTPRPPTGLDPEGSGEVGREGHPELSAQSQKWKPIDEISLRAKPAVSTGLRTGVVRGVSAGRRS